jgi:cyclophilin family peptidyl-prolyl cis-trans isomerase
MGTIKVELYEDKVPNTVDNFIKLANDGFYEGLVFHRVIDDFMIQGGGFYPDGNQKSSPYGPIDLEIHPDVKHVDGAIAMARTSDPDSATSQFFIDDGAQPNLEPGGVSEEGYAAFGVTIDGIDVVRDIASVSTTTKNGMNDWPVEDVIINSITIQ